jgi:hypothetical protein
MGLIPDSRAGTIALVQSKIAPWTASATQIGTTVAQINSLDGLLTGAQDAIAAQVAAEQTRKTLTAAADNAIDVLMAAFSDVVKQIRTAAANGNAAQVYQLAEIPAPATPSPVGPPGTPTDFKVKLQPDGWLELIWKCSNPSNAGGPIYHVYRKHGTEDFTFIGGTGEKKFPDTTLPQGVATVIYKVQAVRTTQIGVAAQFVVNFGTTPSGQMTATVAAAPAGPKIAA